MLNMFTFDMFKFITHLVSELQVLFIFWPFSQKYRFLQKIFKIAEYLYVKHIQFLTHSVSQQWVQPPLYFGLYLRNIAFHRKFNNIQKNVHAF